MAKSTKYYGGRYARKPNGRFRGRVYAAYRRYEKSWKTEREVRIWIVNTVNAIQDRERQLTSDEIKSARRAINRLPEEVSLETCADFYIRNAKTQYPDLSIDDALSEYFEFKRGDGLKASSIAAMQGYLGRFQRENQGLALQDIKAKSIMNWMNEKELHGLNRTNQIRYLRGFFRWCVKSSYLGADPTAPLSTPKVDQKLPEVLTVEQGRALLEAAEAHDPDICAYIALGCFAGIRVAELRQIRWDDIGAEHVHIRPAVAKIRQQRYVDITQNCRLWMGSYVGSGEVAPDDVSKRMKRLREKAGIVTWPRNGMRHSFATYHLALHQNAPKTAHQLGHTNVNMLYNHYRNLANKKQGDEWFDICPSK